VYFFFLECHTFSGFVKFSSNNYVLIVTTDVLQGTQASLVPLIKFKTFFQPDVVVCTCNSSHNGGCR
jgi:hypothetical protein